MGKRLNNRGMTLVELLISMGVAGFVMVAISALLSNGIKQYNKTVIMTQLQEDASTTINNVCDAIMEGNYIDISTSKTDPTVQTKAPITVNGVVTGENVIYTYMKTGTDAGSLFVGTSSNEDDRALLCRNVKDFHVEIINTSLVLEDGYTSEGDAGKKVVGFRNPVQIRVTLELELQGYSRQVTRTVSVRNQLSDGQLNIQNFTFGSTLPLSHFETGGFIVSD
jgi:prepilin-type N-terminal cleavage/methylation domain-containing protein